MSRRQNAKFMIAILAAILLLFTVADFYKEFVAKDEVSFVGEAKWVSLQKNLQILCGRITFDGTYLGDDGYTFTQHLPKDYEEATCAAAVAWLEGVTTATDAKVFLIPDADVILADKLPSYVPKFDQLSLLETAKASLSEDAYFDAAASLLALAEEKETVYTKDTNALTEKSILALFRLWAEKKTALSKGPMKNRTLLLVGDEYANEDVLTLFGRLYGEVVYLNIQDYAAENLETILTEMIEEINSASAETIEGESSAEGNPVNATTAATAEITEDEITEAEESDADVIFFMGLFSLLDFVE